ncbi:hypothetical protein ACFXJO_05615 [Streptomyces lavendulae]|uniref:hypothetical protein n=1 Tax=Streptomyces lavendulae TaxID=1914 RepID=UPI00367D29D5
MIDIDDVSPGDELPDDTDVLCCGQVMDATGITWSCPACRTAIETRSGLVFAIRD